MDVGFYLGELLMQQGEISVPGLGYFVQARISGYYDENERKFYPPYHQVQFDLQSIDDDALAEYIAVKKNISLASARYFAEKYITNLKQQALITEVPIGNLGWFYTELAQLAFRPAPKVADDTIFFGLEPVSISKANDTPLVEDRPKVELNFPNRSIHPTPSAIEEIQDAAMQPPFINDEAVDIPYYETEPQNNISPEFFDPAEEHTTSSFSRALRVVLFVLIGIIVIAIGIFALYRYQPDTFAKITFWKLPRPAENVKPKLTPAVKPADTLATDSVIADTNIVTAAPAAADTLTQSAQNPKVISETPVEQGTSPRSKIISVTPVDQSKTSNKKEIIISKTPVNPTATPLLNTAKKQGTVTPQASAAVTKTKPASAIASSSSNRLIAKPSDAVGTHRFEVYAITTNSIAEANAAIRKMRKFGLDPRIVTDAPGTLIHISIGHFATHQEAKNLASKEIEAGHIPGGYAYAFEIIPQK